MPKRLLRCQSAAVRYLDFEQISLIHSPFRRAFTIISMNFILAFNTEAKLKTRQLPSKVVHRTRTFPKRKNAVERTDERAAIFVLNARFRLFIHQPYACAVVIQLCPRAQPRAHMFSLRVDRSGLETIVTFAFKMAASMNSEFWRRINELKIQLQSLNRIEGFQVNDEESQAKNIVKPKILSR